MNALVTAIEKYLGGQITTDGLWKAWEEASPPGGMSQPSPAADFSLSIFAAFILLRNGDIDDTDFREELTKGLATYRAMAA